MNLAMISILDVVCRRFSLSLQIYPKGVSDRLVREPLKENPLPGEPKAYDSVQVRYAATFHIRKVTPTPCLRKVRVR